MIFNKLFKDILKFFIIAIFLIGLIVWTLQAINYFDFVTEDGHGLKVYFLYTLLNFPKIIHRILPFIFFITLFYIIINYEMRNELNIFWFNGISKIKFANKIIILSLFLMFFQIFMGSYLSPKSQLQARTYLKNSDINFFSSLIKEGKFINIIKDLTIFIESKNEDGTFNNIFIDDTTKIQKRMIYAKEGYILSNINNKIFKLSKGKVINIENNNTTTFEFSEIDFNLSNFSSNTITVPKIQEINSTKLLSCFFDFQIPEFDTFKCDKKINSEIMRELLKRFVKPFYIPLIAIICCFVIVSSKNKINFKKNNYIVFFVIFIVILFSEALVRYFSETFFHFFIYLIIPLISFTMSYVFFFTRVKHA
ncbi:LptF/LptG family permease [Candidatus Pelagibacter communis]|uniref:LptF/LptG family permease n=1 Tax=Candidatus Pelagibacter TaxID=198251 RepID=UPI003EDF35DE